MKDSKTHWKKNFNYDYLGSHDLPEDSDLVLTITEVGKKIVANKGGNKEECLVMSFKEKVNGANKPMILNKTNCKTIEYVYNTPYIEQWVGKKITLYVEKNVQAFGEYVNALRIRETAPQKEVLTESYRNFNAVVDAWRKGQVGKVKERFEVTPEMESKLDELSLVE